MTLRSLPESPPSLADGSGPNMQRRGSLLRPGAPPPSPLRVAAGCIPPGHAPTIWTTLPVHTRTDLLQRGRRASVVGAYTAAVPVVLPPRLSPRASPSGTPSAILPLPRGIGAATGRVAAEKVARGAVRWPVEAADHAFSDQALCALPGLAPVLFGALVGPPVSAVSSAPSTPPRSPHPTHRRLAADEDGVATSLEPRFAPGGTRVEPLSHTATESLKALADIATSRAPALSSPPHVSVAASLTADIALVSAPLPTGTPVELLKRLFLSGGLRAVQPCFQALCSFAAHPLGSSEFWPEQTRENQDAAPFIRPSRIITSSVPIDALLAPRAVSPVVPGAIGCYLSRALPHPVPMVPTDSASTGPAGPACPPDSAIYAPGPPISSSPASDSRLYPEAHLSFHPGATQLHLPSQVSYRPDAKLAPQRTMASGFLRHGFGLADDRATARRPTKHSQPDVTGGDSESATRWRFCGLAVPPNIVTSVFLRVPPATADVSAWLGAADRSDLFLSASPSLWAPLSQAEVALRDLGAGRARGPHSEVSGPLVLRLRCLTPVSVPLAALCPSSTTSPQLFAFHVVACGCVVAAEHPLGRAKAEDTLFSSADPRRKPSPTEWDAADSVMEGVGLGALPADE
jgi:hypothetical protein